MVGERLNATTFFGRDNDFRVAFTGMFDSRGDTVIALGSEINLSAVPSRRL